MNAIRNGGASSSPQHWTEEGSYIDAHRHGQGHSEIDAMLAATQTQFPNYRLSLVSGIEAHSSFVRFSWAAGGTAEAPLFLCSHRRLWPLHRCCLSSSP